MTEQETEQGASGAVGAPGGAGVPGTMGTRGTAGTAGIGGVGGTGGTGGTGRQGDPGPPGTSHTAVVVQQTKLSRWQRILLIALIVALIVVAALAQVRGVYADRASRDIIRDKNTQVDSLRVRAVQAEQLTTLNVNIRLRALCRYLGDVDGFEAAIAGLILMSPNVTPEQRVIFQPFTVIGPTPKECLP